MIKLSNILAKLLDYWHHFISPALPGACRFEPSCSQYFAQALRDHGVVQGTGLGLKRLSRCHPWGDHGFDPVPTMTSKKGLS